MLGQGQHAGLEVGLFRGSHSGHLLKVLGGLLFHDVHHVVYRDDTHQTALLVHHGQGDKVVLHHPGHRFLLVLGGLGGDHVGLHQVGNKLLVLG